MDRREFIQRILPTAGVLPFIDPAMERLLGQKGIEKVKDSKKKITDQLAIDFMSKRNVNKDYVEFFEYTKGRERSKRYRDRVSGREFQVMRGNFKARPDDGTLIVPRLHPGLNKWTVGNNMFEGEITSSGRISLSPHESRGNLAKDQIVTWNPVLYLNNVIQHPISSPKLLAFDPVNGLLENNTIEIDYGICKRWLRISYGQFFERWVFTDRPNGNIKIEHNYEGPSGVLELGRYAKDADTEEVFASDLDEFETMGTISSTYPFIVSATSTFYTDDSGNCFDGTTITYGITDVVPGAYRPVANATVINAATYSFVHNKWEANLINFMRAFFVFDTSSIPNTDVINSGEFSIVRVSYGATNNPPLCCLSTGSTLGLDNLTAAHHTYQNTHKNQISDYIYASTIGNTYTWTLNSEGRDFIDKEDRTCFAMQNTYDMNEVDPPKVDSRFAACDFSEKAGGYDPKLVVEHEPAPTSGSNLFGMGAGKPMGYDGITKVMGH